MRILKSKLFAGLALCLLTCSAPLVCAQDGGTDSGRRAPGALLEIKLNRQTQRVNQALNSGALTQKQADVALSKIKAIRTDIKQRRDANGGSLKLNDVQEFANRLESNRDYLSSLVGTGEKLDDGPNVLGPNWKPGKDGAQNATSLRQEMKKEERRELRQERQAIQQVQEQQQLQYEKEMMQKFGNQRATIMDQKKDLNSERKVNGN